MSVSQAIRNPRGYIVRTAGMYRALLFDPERFYDEYVGSRGIKVEIVLVLFIGLVGLAGNYYAKTRLETVFTEAGFAIGNEVNFILWGNTVAPLVGIVLLWVGITIGLFVLSWLYTTVGNFYHLLKYTAWAMVPLFVFNLLHTAAMAWAAFQLQESDVADLQIPRPPNQRAVWVWDAVAAEIYVLATIVIGALIVVWSAYIALQAVVDVRQLERRDAYKVVAVPFGAFALYLLYDVFQTMTTPPA